VEHEVDNFFFPDTADRFSIVETHSQTHVQL
jgi:hypothetical protein